MLSAVWQSLAAMTRGLSCLTGASLCPALGFCDSSCHSNPKRAVVMRSFGSSDWVCVFPEKCSCVGLQSNLAFSSWMTGSPASSQTYKTEKRRKMRQCVHMKPLGLDGVLQTSHDNYNNNSNSITISAKDGSLWAQTLKATTVKLLDYCSRLHTRMHKVIKPIKTVFCLADTCLLMYAVW